MKKITVLLVCVLTILATSLFACNQASEPSDSNNAHNPEYGETDTGDHDEKNTLIAYFSCTGTTKSVAEKIKNVLDCDIFEIQPQIPYTSADLNYSNSNCRANVEQNDASARPAIANSIENFEYDVVFVGYPIWWGKAPKIIYTFLEQYDLSEKIIVPFCTSGGSSVSGSEGDLHALEPSATWKSGARFSSSTTQTTISAWIDSLNL